MGGSGMTEEQLEAQLQATAREAAQWFGEQLPKWEMAKRAQKAERRKEPEAKARRAERAARLDVKAARNVKLRDARARQRQAQHHTYPINTRLTGE